jgi:tripartite-type tricarboxylate transporter receptor subunit TctC
MESIGKFSAPISLTAVVSVVFALLLSCEVAQSQARTIKIINPYPPGGTADIVARVVSEEIGRAQGVTMLIENRPGAGTVIGTEAAARAAPDGNTLLITSVAFVINPHLRKLNYDPLRNFQPICNLTQSPQLVVVNSGSRYRTMADLVNAARAQPGALTFASTGPASPSQIAFEMLERAANVQMIYVPFPGNAPTVNAVLGGHVTAGIANYADVVGHLTAGTLRALATFVESHRVIAGSADGRRVRPQGIRVRGLVRDACAGEDPERNGRPALGLVCRGDAGTRGQGEARRPGPLSRRDVRGGVRPRSCQAIRRLRPHHSRSEYQG